MSHGDTVRKGDLLVQLRNTDLEVAITDVEGQRMANNERPFATQRALIEEKKLSLEERNRLAGEQAELRQKQQTLDAQWGLYKSKQLELEVKSPINGLVVTWDLRNRLIQRPVQRGQELLRVADPEGRGNWNCTCPKTAWAPWPRPSRTCTIRRGRNYGNCCGRTPAPSWARRRPRKKSKRRSETALAEMPDDKLHDRILDEFRQRLDNQLQPILKDVADEEMRGKLGEVLREKSMKWRSRSYRRSCRTLRRRTAIYTPS